MKSLIDVPVRAILKKKKNCSEAALTFQARISALKSAFRIMKVFFLPLSNLFFGMLV